MSILSFLKITKGPASTRFNKLSDNEIPRYPPFVKGFPLVPARRLLKTQHELIILIRKSLELNNDEYSTYLYPVFERYASFVHLLPASENNHHSGAGGLLSHGLDVSFRALRASDKYKPFDAPMLTDPPVIRREKHKVWRLAVCLAGLLHDIAKPMTDVRVTNKEGDNVWDMTHSLIEWGDDNDIERYFIHWIKNRHKKHEIMNMMLIDRILGPTTYYIREVSTDIVSDMIASIVNNSDDTLLHQLVKAGDVISSSEDVQTRLINEYESETSVPVFQFIKNEMNALVESNTWTINKKGSRIWLTDKGCFIFWRAAAKDIMEGIRKKNIKGVPQHWAVMADILVERGMAEPFVHGNETSSTWRVGAEIVTRENDQKRPFFTMLKIKDPVNLFNYIDRPPPIKGYIEIEEKEKIKALEQAKEKSHAPVASNTDATPVSESLSAIQINKEGTDKQTIKEPPQMSEKDHANKQLKASVTNPVLMATRGHAESREVAHPNNTPDNTSVTAIEEPGDPLNAPINNPISSQDKKIAQWLKDYPFLKNLEDKFQSDPAFIKKHVEIAPENNEVFLSIHREVFMNNQPAVYLQELRSHNIAINVPGKTLIMAHQRNGKHYALLNSELSKWFISQKTSLLNHDETPKKTDKALNSSNQTVGDNSVDGSNTAFINMILQEISEYLKGHSKNNTFNREELDYILEKINQRYKKEKITKTKLILLLGRLKEIHVLSEQRYSLNIGNKND